jgi:hypothetical protein
MNASRNTDFLKIFFLEFFSINFDPKIWLNGPNKPVIEVNIITSELLEFTAIANGEM